MTNFKWYHLIVSKRKGIDLDFIVQDNCMPSPKRQRIDNNVVVERSNDRNDGSCVKKSKRKHKRRPKRSSANRNK